MTVYLNGTFVPEEEAVVSVFDRSFLYGDGLFETLRVSRWRPFRWAEHISRLEKGAKYLGIGIPNSSNDLLRSAEALLKMNQLPEAILRIQLSRGCGKRGYSTREANHASLVMTVHAIPDLKPDPPVWRLITSSFRVVAEDPLTRLKSCNKLIQILARKEAEARGADEALLLNKSGDVAETTSGNICWCKGDFVITPPVESGALPGITRQIIKEICEKAGLTWIEKLAHLEEVRGAEGVFLTMAAIGIVEVSSLDEFTLSRNQKLFKINQAYRQELERETSEKRLPAN